MRGILVVEYDPLVMSIIKSVLSTRYRVLAARSREQALEFLKRRADEIDVVIADLTLPDGSGVDFAFECSRRAPGIRTIVTSVYPPSMWNDADQREFDWLPPQSVALLQKPFLPSALLQVIADLVEVPQQLTAARALAMTPHASGLRYS